jgi:hypothetical protein
MELYLNLAGLDTKQPVLSPLTHSAPNGGVSPLVAISVGVYQCKASSQHEHNVFSCELCEHFVVLLK